MEDSSDKSFLRFYQQLQIQRQSVSNGTIMLVMQCVSNAGFVVENVVIYFCLYVCVSYTQQGKITWNILTKLISKNRITAIRNCVKIAGKVTRNRFYV